MNLQSVLLLLVGKISLCYHYVWQIFMGHFVNVTPLGSTDTLFNFLLWSVPTRQVCELWHGSNTSIVQKLFVVRYIPDMCNFCSSIFLECKKQHGDFSLNLMMSNEWMELGIWILEWRCIISVHSVTKIKGLKFSTKSDVSIQLPSPIPIIYNFPVFFHVWLCPAFLSSWLCTAHILYTRTPKCLLALKINMV